MKAFIFFASLFLFAECRVFVGIDVLAAGGFDLIKGKRVGLLSNPTGILPDTLDHVRSVRLCCLCDVDRLLIMCTTTHLR